MSKLLCKSRALSVVFALATAGGCSELATDQDPDPSSASDAGLPGDVRPIVHTVNLSDAGTRDAMTALPPAAERDAASQDAAAHHGDDAGESRGDGGDDHHADDAATPIVADGTFASVYQVLSANCASCHGAGKALDFSAPSVAHASLVNVPASLKACAATDGGTPWLRVVPGELSQSLIVQKLEGHAPCGSQMPMKVLLPQELVEVVRAWVLAGAPAP
ncbi:MAG: hypothetical protein JWN48_446 [Myxococcaceae bacterium]|nr:hypothetical protein [Myxococcaceae bacterium]